MKAKFAYSGMLAGLLLCATVVASAQRTFTMPKPAKPLVPETISNVDSRLAFSNNLAKPKTFAKGQAPIIVAGLPMWQYTTIAAQDGNLYSGNVVGRNPTFRGKIPTNIPAPVIPLTINFLDSSGNVVLTFDPTVPQPCFSGLTTTQLVTGSPVLNASPLTMNGVNVGNVQYVDGFQRSEFWSYINGANYHVNLNPSLISGVVVNVPNGLWGSGTVGCGNIGAIDINAWDTYLQTTLIPSLGLAPTQFPMFVTFNVAWFAPGCCAVGYHNATSTAPNAQTYSSTAIPTPDFFGASFADTVALSHEVGEWMNDPLTVNPTPAWGNIGQVSGCQNNFEVGDPLTPTNFPSITMNGYTYHIQELAYYSWFYGGASLGAGGKYSNNGTFKGDAILCPPGGTN